MHKTRIYLYIHILFYFILYIIFIHYFTYINNIYKIFTWKAKNINIIA